MDNKIPLISYTLAVMSGICFLSGLVIISSEGGQHYGQTWGDRIDARIRIEHKN